MAVCLCGLARAADPLQRVFEKAASALAAQDYAGAESGFKAVLKAQPGNIAALGNLGVVYSRTRRYADATAAYQRALKLAPSDKGLITNLGLAYLKQERYRLAAPLFERLASERTNVQAAELLATCRLSLGEPGAAAQLLEPLRSADPGNAGVLYMLGVAYVRLKRPEEARAAFASMMQVVEPAKAHFLMGKARYETGAFQEAAESFRKAIESDPALPGAHRELGKTLLALRDDESAERELRLSDPNDDEALYYLGGLLAKEQKPGAIPLLTRSLELRPDAWGPLYYLGRVYLDQGSLDKALHVLERAATLQPDEPAIQYQLARAYKKAGKDVEARAALGRVQQLKAKSLKSELDVLSPATMNP